MTIPVITVARLRRALDAELMWFGALEKARGPRGGKYYRRVATGDPKRPWRYYYTRAAYERVHGGNGHLHGPEQLELFQGRPKPEKPKPTKPSISREDIRRRYEETRSKFVTATPEEQRKFREQRQAYEAAQAKLVRVGETPESMTRIWLETQTPLEVIARVQSELGFGQSVAEDMVRRTIRANLGRLGRTQGPRPETKRGPVGPYITTAQVEAPREPPKEPASPTPRAEPQEGEKRPERAPVQVPEGASPEHVALLEKVSQLARYFGSEEEVLKQNPALKKQLDAFEAERTRAPKPKVELQEKVNKPHPVGRMQIDPGQVGVVISNKGKQVLVRQMKDHDEARVLVNKKLAQLKAEGGRSDHFVSIVYNPETGPVQELRSQKVRTFKPPEKPPEEPKTGPSEFQQARRERAERKAARLSAEAKGKLGEARREIEMIPPGQPILVGHHSEKRHRRALERHDQKMRAGLATEREAESARHAAIRAGSSISADDPEAVRLLKEKLTKLETRQQQMKDVNRAYKRGGIEAVREQFGDRYALESAKTLQAQPYYDKPFPGYALTNNNANIRRVKERIQELEKKAQAAPNPAIVGSGFRIVEDTEDNRLRFFFDERPDRETTRKMKQAGFRFSRQHMAWQRQITNQARYKAEDMARQLFGHKPSWEKSLVRDEYRKLLTANPRLIVKGTRQP